jgi:TRAP-type C4-dicarboxylate transport system substrate-binding protein
MIGLLANLSENFSREEGKMKDLKRMLLGLILISFILATSLVGLKRAYSAEEPIRLKVAFWVFPKSVYAIGQDWYLKEVEARSKGKVVFERYWAGSLVQAKDIPDALAGGVADLGSILPGYYPGKFPLADIGSLPGFDNHEWPQMKALYETWQKVPEMQAEFARRKVRPVAVAAYGPYGIWTKKKINALDDLKGLKIRCVGLFAKLIAAIGCVPVAITPPEIYDAMQKGTIDGSISDYDTAVTYGWHRATKYYNKIPVGTGTFFLGISTRTWNRLPADVQRLLDDTVPDAIKAYAQIYEIDGLSNWKKIAVRDGVQEVPFPREVTSKVVEIARTQVWDKWAEDMESKGHAGRKVLDTFVQAVEKYVPLDPMKYE